MSNTNKKPTINEEFAEIIAVIKGEKTLTETEVAEKVAFLNKRIEVNTKKNSSSGSGKKVNPVNAGIAQSIYDYLVENDTALTITQMMKNVPACADLTNQKINGIILRLYDSEKYPNDNPMFVRKSEKGVAYFKANPDYIAEVEGE